MNKALSPAISTWFFHFRDSMSLYLSEFFNWFDFMAYTPTSSSGGVPRGISLSNSVHSEVASCLPLQSLPVFCGALDQELRLFDEQQSAGSRSLNRSHVVSHAGKIAELIRNCDVSYLWVLFFLNLSLFMLFEFELLCFSKS